MVDVGADTRGLRSEVSAAARSASGLDADLDVGADTREALSDAQSATQAIRGQDADLDVGADTREAISAGRAAAGAVDGLRADIRVGADTSAALIQAEAARQLIDAMRAAIKVDTDERGGKNAGVGGLVGAAAGITAFLAVGAKAPLLIGKLVGGLGSLFSVATSVSSAVSEMASGIFKAGASTAQFAGHAGAAAAVVLSIVGAFAQLGAQAAGITVIVGAVTYVVGLLGAAISGLPALLFGVGLAGAATALGFDGIKRAASAAKPALDDLKRAVSDNFARELTPMFEDLGKRVLPLLEDGFVGVSFSVSNMIKSFVGVFTTADGIIALNQALGNTSVFIETMTPGITYFIAQLLKVATVTGGFRELGELVSVIGYRFGELFARFAEGGESSLMVRSLDELGLTMDSLLGLVNELIIGATEFFVGAGPGMRDALDSIRSVVEKIDFESLGTSFGTFVSSVMRLFDAVPQSVWDGLAQSLSDLAGEFERMSSNPDVQAFFSFLIATIPAAISLFASFVGTVTTGMETVRTIFDGAKAGFLQFQLAAIETALSVAESINSVVQAVPFLPQSMQDASQGAVDALRGMREGVATELAETVVGMTDTAPQMGEAGTQVGTAGAEGVAGGLKTTEQMAREAVADAAVAVAAERAGFTSAGQEVGAAGASGLATGIGPMIPEAGDAARGATGSISAETSAARGAGRGVGSGAADGARSGLAPMPGQMGGITADARNRVAGERSGFQSAGSGLAGGMESGISGGAQRIIDAALSAARRAFEAAKRFLGIASPSKLFRREIGARVAEGFALGIADEGSRVTRSMSIVARDVIALGEAVPALVSDSVAGAGAELLSWTSSLTGRVARAEVYAAGHTLGDQISDGIVAGLRAGVPAAVAELQRVQAALARQAAQLDASTPKRKERMVQAEDGSWVPESFYSGGGGGRGLSEADARVLARAHREALDGARLTLGPGSEVRIAQAAERGSTKLDRRR